MTLSPRWLQAGRIFFASFGLIALIALPGVLSTTRYEGCTEANTTCINAARFTGSLAFVAFAGLWAWFWLRLVGRGRRWAVRGTVVAAVVLLGLLDFITPHDALSDGLVFATIMAGASFSWKRGVAAVLGIALLAAAIIAIRLTPPQQPIQAFLNDALVGIAAVAGRLLLLANHQLESARKEIARLAISEERLRFARDLHDLLGQDLAVVVLKSELLARALPPETDASVRAELAEIADAARHALTNVRAAVAAYRRPGIGTELAEARNVLQLAGIELAGDDTLGAIPSAPEGVLAWAVREGVTNVLKHSHATHCSVRLRREQGSAVLEVVDDGAGGSPNGAGSGLKGIEERVRGAGGSFFAGGDGLGFRLQVAVPLLERA